MGYTALILIAGALGIDAPPPDNAALLTVSAASLLILMIPLVATWFGVVKRKLFELALFLVPQCCILALAWIVDQSQKSIDPINGAFLVDRALPTVIVATLLFTGLTAWIRTTDPARRFPR